MTAMYILHEISAHAYEFEDLLNSLDFVIIPVANPGQYAIDR